MTFELLILLSTVVLPAAVMACAFATAIALPKSPHGGSKVALTALAGALSIWLAAGLRNGFDFWPTDSWLRVPIGALLVALAAAATPSNVITEFRWVLRATAILIATWCVLPSGDGFSDLMPSMPLWQLCMSLATLLGWWIIEQVEDRGIVTAACSWMLLMGTGTFLIAQSFAKLSEIMLAVGTVLLIASVFTMRYGRVEIFRATAGPALFAFVAAVSNGQFNSFLGLPDWLSFLAITSPAIAASPLLFPVTRMPNWCRTLIVLSLTIGVALIVVRFSQVDYDS